MRNTVRFYFCTVIEKHVLINFKVSATLKIAICPYLRFQRFQIDMLESFIFKKNKKILFLSKDIRGKRFFLVNYLN